MEKILTLDIWTAVLLAQTIWVKISWKINVREFATCEYLVLPSFIISGNTIQAAWAPQIRIKPDDFVLQHDLWWFKNL